MTYPQLREMISNYTKTLTKKTRSTESSEHLPNLLLRMPLKRTETIARHIFEGLSSMLDRWHPQPSPVTSQLPSANNFGNYAPFYSSDISTKRFPFDLRRDPHRSHPRLHQTHMGYPRRGKGLNPCYVCGAADHPWIHCPRKAPGRGCAVCGSLAHRTNICA